MAAKKPAKKNISNTPEKVKPIIGKAVKYFGMKGSQAFVCPSCKKTFKKGIVYEEKNTLYCSRYCIPKEVSNA